MRRLFVALLSIILFSGFIIPAYKMAELMIAPESMDTLVLNGNAFFNLGKDYINTPVPCRIIIRANGYLKQDYMFPKANVSVVTNGTNQIIIINNTRMLAPLQLFSHNKIFTMLIGLYLSSNPQKLFNEMNINQTQVAYGLANYRAAYIIGNNNNQLFIDNELKVPIIYRKAILNNYESVVVKEYLTEANLANNNANIINGEQLNITVNHYTFTNTTLPRIVELYNGDIIIQRWEFRYATVFNKQTNLNSLLISFSDIKKLPTDSQTFSPFMLY